MPRLTAIVLGSAAGGGVPQWNCRCPVCKLAWEGDRRVTPRTQTSVAVSGDGKAWALLNASPDLRAQIERTPALQPRDGSRASPIASVVLSGAEIDQVAGLLNLRERQAFDLFATAPTLKLLGENNIFDALAPDIVARLEVSPAMPFKLPGGIEAELFPVPGKVPLYLEEREHASLTGSDTNAGVELRANGTRLLFVPGAADVAPELIDRLAGADVILFDGTLFTDDEMIRLGVGSKTGRRMGHMPIYGNDGSVAALARIQGRRIYIHLNNTNPVLIEGSAERKRVEAAGWEVAYDGMEISL